MPRFTAVPLLSLFLAAPLAAQELPALHDVSGVAPGDVLNLRAEPDAGAPILGGLAPDAAGVEVTALDTSGAWGRVNSGEGLGWVSMSFLTPQPGGTMPEVAHVRCFGAEPFWSYEVTQNGEARWTAVDDEEIVLRAGAFRRAAARAAPFVSVAGGPEQQGVLIMHREHRCSDGMSDGLYGLSGEVVLTGRTSRAVSGCCSLRPR